MTQPGSDEDVPRRRSAWWDIPLTIGIALAVVLLLTTFVAKPFSIPSGSMEDTLAIGDRVLVNRVVYHLRDIERDYAAFNEIRTEFFRQMGLNPLPASTGIQAILCRPELLIEMEAMAIFETPEQG